MMDVNGIKELTAALRGRGYDEATARRYAVLIGDTPEVNGAGKWVIRDDHENILAAIDPVLD